MTDVRAAYQPSSHPHVPSGSSAGGEFAPTGGNDSGGKKSAPTKPAHRPAPARHASNDSGSFEYDPQSNTGPGYGMPGGSPKVKGLQDSLVRLGFASRTDKALQDGKYGPRTTAAVKKAQRALGLKPDGIATPEFVAKLAATRHLKAASSEPYGNVEYADPGYQADGKKRYPLDSEAHCRSAWSYVNMPKNAAMYTADQLAQIKAKIKSAGKRYGIDFTDDASKKRTYAAADLLGVEVARPGTWKLASGDLTVTAEMLTDAARYAQRPGSRPSPVKLGHTDPRFSGDGEPALGWLGNLRVEDDNGPVLVGDITGMPDWLAAAAPDHWPDRSMEGWADFTADDGETYALVVDGLALLGVTPPGMSSIRSLRDLPQALGVAASARIVARAPDPPPNPSPQAPPSAGLFAAQPTTPAAKAEEEPPITPKEAGQMNLDPVKIREALGLSADASDDEVKASLVTAGFAPPSGPEAVPLFDIAPKPELVAAGGADQRLAGNAARAGLITIDPAQLEQYQAGMVRAAALAKRLEAQERDTAITTAVKAGKFPPVRRAHYERAWDVDPDGTRELINSLAAGLVPVTAAGYDTDAEDARFDAEFSHLFPPTATKGA